MKEEYDFSKGVRGAIVYRDMDGKMHRTRRKRRRRQMQDDRRDPLMDRRTESGRHWLNRTGDRRTGEERRK